MFYPSLVVAILAAIVASQAMITATFQLLSQVMKLSYFPQIRVVHTSRTFQGQIYIPFANWLLMIGTVIVTGVYNNTTSLGHAYGVCVILVTFITTCMVALVAIIIWRLPFYVVLPVFIIFAALDGLYLSSALTKVPEGAWFTLALAVLLSSIFILWRYGKENQWRAEISDRFSLSRLIANSATTTDNSAMAALKLTPAFGASSLTSLRGLTIFFDKTGQPNTTPSVFIHFVQKFLATSDVVVFFHLRQLAVPTISPEDQWTVSREAALPNCFRVVVRHGYADEVVTRGLAMLVYDRLRDFVIREEISINAKPSRCIGDATVADEQPPSDTSRPYQALGAITTEIELKDDAIEQAMNDPTVEQVLVAARLRQLQAAYETQVIYAVGKEHLRIRKNANGENGKVRARGFLRRGLLAAFLWLRANSSRKVASWDLDAEDVVEVGFVKDM